MARRLLVPSVLLTLSAPLHAESPPPQPAPPAVGALIGAALHVADLDRAIAFYTRGLAMSVATQIGPADRRETMLGFGADPRQPHIILLSDSTAAPSRPIEHRFGYDRLVLRMTDLPGVVARLRAAGYIASDVRDGGVSGFRVAVATDPDGYKLELVERLAPKEKAP